MGGSLKSLLAYIAPLLLAPPAGWLAARLATRFSAPVKVPAAPVIAATIAAYAWADFAALPPWVLGASLGLAWTLLCLGAVDLAVYRLPDLLTLPLAVAGLAIAAVLPGRPILDHLVGGAAGWSALALVAEGYRRWRGVDGMGMGDAKLLGAAGAWLGWEALPSVLLIACFSAFAGVAAGALMGGRTARGSRIAFGAPLSLAFWIVWLHGPLNP